MPLVANGVTAEDLYANAKYTWEAWYNGNLVFEPVEKLLFTTDLSAPTTTINLWFNEWSGAIGRRVDLIVKKDGVTIKEESIPIGGTSAFNFDVVESGVSVFVKAHEPTFLLIKELRLRGSDFGVDTVYPEIFPRLTKLNVANQSNLQSVNLSQNLDLDRLEMYSNGLTGTIDISMLDKLLSVELFGNNLSGISPVTNHPVVTYYNVSENPNLTSYLDFTSSPDIHTILAFGCDLSGINITGRTNLFEVGISQNLNMSQAIDLNSCPNIEVFTAEQVPLTDVTWNLLSKVRGFFVAANSIPQASIQAGINANKPVLEAVSVISMPQITAPLDFDDCPNLHFLWCTDLNNCTGISWDNSDAINNLSIVGMHALSHAIDITGKTINEYFGVTGTTVTPTNLDNLLIYISSLNVPPLHFNRPGIPGPGTVLYGDYGTAIGTIHPTSASLAAYNDLVARGYTVVGPVPGT